MFCAELVNFVMNFIINPDFIVFHCVVFDCVKYQILI